VRRLKLKPTKSRAARHQRDTASPHVAAKAGGLIPGPFSLPLSSRRRGRAQEDSDDSALGNLGLAAEEDPRRGRYEGERGGGPRPATMRPRAAATPTTTGDASRGISRSPLPLALRLTCVLALLVHAATWIPVTEAVVSVNCVLEHSRDDDTSRADRCPSAPSCPRWDFLWWFLCRRDQQGSRSNGVSQGCEIDDRVRWIARDESNGGGGGVNVEGPESARIGEPEVECGYEHGSLQRVSTQRILMRRSNYRCFWRHRVALTVSSGLARKHGSRLRNQFAIIIFHSDRAVS